MPRPYSLGSLFKDADEIKSNTENQESLQAEVEAAEAEGSYYAFKDLQYGQLGVDGRNIVLLDHGCICFRADLPKVTSPHIFPLELTINDTLLIL